MQESRPQSHQESDDLLVPAAVGRVKRTYKKYNLIKRKALVHMVQQERWRITHASKYLDIELSSGRLILSTFLKEGRYFQKRKDKEKRQEKQRIKKEKQKIKDKQQRIKNQRKLKALLRKAEKYALQYPLVKQEQIQENNDLPLIKQEYEYQTKKLQNPMIKHQDQEISYIRPDKDDVKKEEPIMVNFYYEGVLRTALCNNIPVLKEQDSLQ